MKVCELWQRLGALVRTKSFSVGAAVLAALTLASSAGAATVVQVSSTFTSGTRNIGDVIVVRVRFDEPVIVTGVPTLLLETGATDRSVPYLSMDGPDTLYFEYTVQEGDVSPDLDYVSTTALSLNGGLIRDSVLANADITLPAPGSLGSLGGFSNYVVDGVPPTVTSIVPGAYAPRSPSAQFVVEFSEAVLGFTIDDMFLQLTGSAGPSITSVQESAPGRYVVNVEGLTGEGSIDLLLLNNGTDITDLAGNPIAAGGFSLGTIDYDLIAPSQPIITSPTVDFFPNGNVTFSGTAELNTSVWITLDSGGLAIISVNSAGNWSFTPSSPLPDGENAITIFAEDSAGNTSGIAFFPFTVDSTPPAVPAFTSPAPSQVFPTPSITLAGTAERGADVEVQVDAGAGFSTIGTVIASATGQWSLTTLATDGSTARARAIDGFGRASAFSAPVQIAIDSTGPVVTSVQFPVAGAYGAGDALDFTVNFDEVAVVAEVGGFRLALNIGGQTFYADYLSGSGTEELTFRHVIQAGAQDTDGVTITALEPNGGVIVDEAANVANLTLSGVALNLVIVDAVGPTVVLSAPAGVLTGPFTLTITFSEDIYNFTVDEVVAVNATVSAFSGSSGNYVATITPTGGEITLSVAAGAAEDELGNPSLDATPLVIATASVLTELEANADLIREIIVDQALRDLRARIAATERMVKAAQDRLASDSPLVDRALSFQGTLQADGLTVASKGSFGAETGLANGSRRILWGEFSVTRDAEGTTSARLDTTLAWERRLSDDALTAWFLGLEVGNADIDRSFSGPLRTMGVSFGAYGVQRLNDTLFLRGFASVSAGRNDLELSNGILSLQSDYITRSMQAGATLAGVLPMDGWELRPALSLALGRTRLGTLDLSGTAYGDTGELQLDAGNVTLATLTFQPEFVVPLGGAPVADSLSLVTFAPGLTCEMVSGVEDWSDCGIALGLGLQHSSETGLVNYNADLDFTRVGRREDTSISLSLEYRF